MAVSSSSTTATLRRRRHRIPGMSEATAPERGPTIAARGALGAGAAILYVFLWATAFVPSRVLARDAPPLWILTIRFAIAGGILLALAAAMRLPIPRDLRTWTRLFALGLGANALYLGLTYLALRHLSAGMGSIIASTNPLILALLAPWLLREPLSARRCSGSGSSSTARRAVSARISSSRRCSVFSSPPSCSASNSPAGTEWRW